MSTQEIRERKFGPEGFTAMDAVEGLAKRMRERTGSVHITIGHDRIESYALALEHAATLLQRVEELEADTRLEGHIFNAYGRAFPNYAWSDLETAVDLMLAEIIAVRKERDRYKAALGKISRTQVSPYPASGNVRSDQAERETFRLCTIATRALEEPAP